MIFITGGAGQGMQQFAMRQFGRQITGDAVDGSAASWEEFKKAEYGIHLEAMIRRRLEEEEQKRSEVPEKEEEQKRSEVPERKEKSEETVRPEGKEGLEGQEESLEHEMAEELFHACPQRIVITQEIGCGIVPVDAFERKYRELTGRICCQLAAASQEVWRVTAGIGQRIK